MSDSRRLVAFDATPLESRQPTGVGRYTGQLLKALLARDDGCAYAAIAARPLSGEVLQGTIGQPGPRLPNRTLWMQCVLPFVLSRMRPALCHFTNSIAPLATATPYVLTVHDMSLFVAARTQPLRGLVATRGLLPACARRAAAVVTVSDSARADILRVLKLDPDRVHVVPEAPAPAFTVMDDAALADVRRRHALDRPFVLHVGTIEPRKNLTTLVTAFERLHREGRREQLVLVGPLGWKYDPLLQQIARAGLGDAIRHLGYVPEADLPAIYNLATVVAYPSLYEGCGLPILEGMACGVPVVTSNTGAMAEMAGGAALLVDPHDADDLAAALARVLGDAAVQRELRQKGLRRAASFSWTRAAEQHAALYARVAGRG